MCGIPFAWLMVWTGNLFAGGATFYHGAVIMGFYKDPLMAQFRGYGEERHPYPVCRFLVVVGAWCLVLALTIGTVTVPGGYYRGVFPPLIFVVLAGMAFGASFLIGQRPMLRDSLPRWYFALTRVSTRQERRFIAFAWLRIPPKMRWRLNSDQAAFGVWADMVRISVTYGARDPDDPWRVWT